MSICARSDTNVVEDGAMDRFPAREDSQRCVAALQDLKSMFNVVDGWRSENPDDKAYTCLQSDGHGSRIDKIFATDEIIETARQWKIETAPIYTDHRMVSVEITDPKTPFVGKGRRAMTLTLLKDRVFIKETNEVMNQALAEIEQMNGGRSEDHNPQTIYKAMKTKIDDLMTKRSRLVVPKKVAELREWETKLDRQMNEPEANIEVQKTAVALLKKKVETLKRSCQESRRQIVAAKNRVYGEVIGKYWSRQNKEKTTRDIVYRLQIPESDPPRFAERSDRMAEESRDWHDKMQQADIPDRREDERPDVLEEVLSKIPRKLTERQKAEMNELMTEELIIRAIKTAACGKAPGIDGIAYELWKLIQQKYEASQKRVRIPDRAQDNAQGRTRAPETKAVNIAKLFKLVFNDMEQNGVVPGTGFAEGWMCPIHKKGSKEVIGNYRPITLLNTDYKLFTKAMSTKLTKVIHDLIHPDQAGFIPGWSILNQVELVNSMIEYAEAVEINGAIVALDQEKAYDKIGHDYLWKVLKAANLAERFINTLKSLYENAETRVMINGVLSTPFRVTRGVRQGDPLSCLVFNLAIEPLAEMLRTSNLQGVRIPGVPNNIVTSLFADDTTVILTNADDFAELTGILRKWCLGARAKFNDSKAMVLPIGTAIYRKQVLDSRRLDPNGSRIPENMYIVPDQETIRLLGARVGNEVDVSVPWTMVIDKLERKLGQWRKTFPTVIAKRLILQMFSAGMTQYPACVQGMPDSVLTELNKITKSYLWDSEGKKSVIDLKTLYLPKHKGGLDLVDLAARNDAVELMKLKAFMSIGKERPVWAFIMDDMLQRNITTTSGVVQPNAVMAMYLQAWTANTSKLPKNFQRIVEVASKYGIAVDAMNPDPSVLEEMPMWHSLAVEKTPETRLRNNAPKSKCLREAHRVRTIKDAMMVAENIRRRDHKARANCKCDKCKAARNQGCKNPHLCYQHAGRLLNQIQDKWDPRQLGAREDNNGEEEEVDPTIFKSEFQPEKRIGECIRIFAKQKDIHRTRPVPARPEPTDEDEIAVLVCGSRTADQYGTTAVGGWVWYAPGDARNIAVRGLDNAYTTDEGRVEALIRLLSQAPPARDIKITIDSKTLANRLTKGTKHLDDTGCAGMPGKDRMIILLAWLRAHRGKITILAEGEGSRRHDIMAAKLLALEGARMPYTAEVTPPPAEYKIHGLKLACLTQATAYRAVRDWKEKSKTEGPPERRTAAANIDRIKWAVKEQNGAFPSEQEIWKAIRQPEITRSIKAFWWRTIQGGYFIGDRWTHTQTPWRADCPRCRTEESMEHILLECEIPGQEIVWDLAKSLWEKTGREWKEPTLGSVLGCTLMKFKKGDGKEDKGANRLYAILISESQHLIWKLRNERRIHNADDDAKNQTANEIKGRWRHKIQGRLDTDRALTNRSRFGKKALRLALVHQTWSGVVRDERTLAPNWETNMEVLVGIG